MYLDSKVANSPSDICSLFASFFQSNYIVDQNGSSSCTSHPLPFDSVNIHISEDDVLKGIIALKYGRKLDVDNLSSFLLKECSSSVLKPLSLLFNASLSEGFFIDDWKISAIVPIFKSGNKKNILNYRPISKLTCTSKLFEVIMNEKIFKSLHDRIIPQQHGFVPGRSTVTNLTLFSEYCLSAFRDGCQVDTIYTDFSKAFDRVSHSILLDKLYKFGLNYSLIKWVSSYLSNRSSYVSVCGVNSPNFHVSSGVPQGSILGPFLFNVFINDITEHIQYAKCLLFADDLKLFLKINTLTDMHCLQSDLNAIHTWCTKNHLDLNVSKCFFCSFHMSKTPILTNYKISATALAKLNVVKDLGVYFDYNLSFTSHLNYVIPKAYSCLAFIRRNCHSFVDPYSVVSLYNCFVRSKLEYASFIWSPYYEIHIKRIERVQKVFLKFALRQFKFPDPLPTYAVRCQLIGLKPLQVRRMALSLTFVADIVSGRVNCADLFSLINLNTPTRVLRNHDLFCTATYRRNYAVNAPINRALCLLNILHRMPDISIDFTLSKFAFKAAVFYALSLL